jgi:hypothetical protein
MSISLYEITVPSFVRAFESLQAVLDKGEAALAADGKSADTLLQSKLFPDMAPLVAQIQRASDTAKGTVVRVTGIENVAFPDEETSFADLRKRIAATVALLKSLSPEQFAGKEDAVITVKGAGDVKTYLARDYVTGFAIPNFYFHITVAYALLRHNGVTIGKRDYLGNLPIQPAAATTA